MIFYFSATGNSKFVAQEVAKTTNERLISIGKAMRESSFSYELQAEETIGFVFPVYFAGIPVVVNEFMKKLELQNYKGNYVFVICTCGAIAGNALKVFKHQLNKRSIKLNAGFAVKMVDNYILMLNLLPPKEQWKKINEGSMAEIQEIDRLIAARHNDLSRKYTTFIPFLITVFQYNFFYKNSRSTKPFYATDKCVNCGLCLRICPMQTIEMLDGKPHWTKEKCCQCLACLHRCPQTAIEYGKKTINRGRYINLNVSFTD